MFRLAVVLKRNKSHAQSILQLGYCPVSLATPGRWSPRQLTNSLDCNQRLSAPLYGEVPAIVQKNVLSATPVSGERSRNPGSKTPMSRPSTSQDAVRSGRKCSIRRSRQRSIGYWGNNGAREVQEGLFASAAVTRSVSRQRYRLGEVLRATIDRQLDASDNEATRFALGLIAWRCTRSLKLFGVGRPTSGRGRRM
jgi:hypothetical protein